jgi:outer membrane lipoprotein
MMETSTVVEHCFRVALAGCVAVALSGCARSAHQTGQDLLDQVIPPHIQEQVDESVTFAQLRASPDSYIGRTVMFSGLSMKAQRVKDHTEIEVLQVPTDEGMTPSDRRSQSEGRFIAVKSGEFLDPAVIEKGSPLTVVGEVKGATTKKLDEGEYIYPVIEIKHLVDWNEVRTRDRDRPYRGYGYGAYPYGAYPYYGYGPYAPWYYGYGSPFWGGAYGFYPYSYYGPYYVPYGGGFSSPAPSPPPRSSMPQDFR